MTNLTGEGEVAAQFPIYRLDLNGEPFERVAACNTIDEVLAYKSGRPDRRCVVLVRRKPVTMLEFREWAKTQLKG
jgi:hypothetical protein